MNIEDFFALIWGQGTGLIASIDANKNWKHKKCATIGDAAALVKKLDAARAPVYHSCSLYEGTPRTAANVKSVRSFWLDIDCGDGKGYPTQKDALAALGQFVDELGLPSPYIINSGGGIHVYWPLDKNIRKEQWLPVAQALKAACKQFGLKADPSRTADVASVLRPIETTNHKHGKTVSVLIEGEVSDLLQIYNTLSVYRGDSNLDQKPAHVSAPWTDDLDAGLDTPTFDPPAADVILAGCAALRSFESSKGNLGEPEWYAALGVTIHLEDGENLAHEWSKGYPKYQASETQKKIEQLKRLSGPTSCEKMSEHFDECATCPLRGQIKNPLQIGRTVPVDVDEIDLGGSVFVAPPVPDGYRIAQRNGVYGVYKKPSDPAEPDTPVYPAILYVDSFVSEGHNNYMNVVEQGPRGRTDARIALDMFSDKAWVKPMLNSCMMINDKNARHIKDYLQSFVPMRGALTPHIQAYDNMGWHADGLLVGERMYTSKGTVEHVKLNDSIKEYAKGMEPKGNYKAWASLVDKLLNQPGLEHMQFMLMCSFASPLLHLMGDEGSILVYGHSGTGGYGKTTAERIALSVWGTWNERSRALERTTENAWGAMLSGMSHLPVIYDELTNYDDRKLSQFIHNISSGKPKARLDRNSKPVSMPNQWDLIVCASGNTLLSDKLSTVKSNASAELSRIFEYTFPHLKQVSNILPAEATVMMKDLEEHVGSPGQEYAKALATMRPKLKATLATVLRKMAQKHNLEGVERYYARLLAAVIVATKLARGLGLVQFDEVALENWIVATIQKQQKTIEEVTGDHETKFYEMLQDLWPDILITAGDDNFIAKGRGMGVEILQRPRGSVKGWQCVPNQSETLGPGATVYTIPTFLLFESAVKQWCVKRSLDYRHMMDEWAKANLIIAGVKRKRRYGRGLMEFRSAFANAIEVRDPMTSVGAVPLTAQAAAAI